MKLAQECNFKSEQIAVTFLPKSTYKIAIELGVNAQQLKPHTCLLDTGAGLIVVSKAFLKSEWLPCIMKQQFPRLRTATKKPISLDGIILLFIRIGDFSVREWFGIVGNLALDILLGTSFIYRHIRGVFSSERKVVPWNSSLASILLRNSSAVVQHHICEQDREKYI